MSPLPHVTEFTRERIAREFDELGPEVCMAEITGDLRQNNPELLDMFSRCAMDVGDPPLIMWAGRQRRLYACTGRCQGALAPSILTFSGRYPMPAPPSLGASAKASR